MSVLSAFIVGVAAGFLPLFFMENYKDHRTRRRIALAINQEIESIFKLVEAKGWLPFLKGEQTEIGECPPPVTFNYFQVYESNLHLITLLQSKLSENMIHFYNRAKGLLEDMKIYDDTFKQNGDENKLENRKKWIVNEYSSLEVLKEEIAKGVEFEDKKVFIISRLTRVLCEP